MMFILFIYLFWVPEATVLEHSRTFAFHNVNKLSFFNNKHLIAIFADDILVKISIKYFDDLCTMANPVFCHIMFKKFDLTW